jgi:hypothetical protein
VRGLGRSLSDRTRSSCREPIPTRHDWIPNGSWSRLYRMSPFLPWIALSSRPLPSSPSVHRPPTRACSLTNSYTDTTFVHLPPPCGFGEYDFIRFVSISPCNFLRDRIDIFAPSLPELVFYQYSWPCRSRPSPSPLTLL